MHVDTSANMLVSNMATSKDAGSTKAATSECGLGEAMAEILARHPSCGSREADKTGSD
jgi:hypothetical protein